MKFLGTVVTVPIFLGRNLNPSSQVKYMEQFAGDFFNRFA